MKVGTVVRVADNTGARFLRVIKVLRKKPRGSAKTGDIVIGSVFIAAPRRRIKKGHILRAMVIRCADYLKREDGHSLRFQYPSVVIVDKNGIPRGNNIHGPVTKELRQRGFIRIVSLSTIAL